jgi:mannose-1-phosphate guanylyltransferase
MRIARMDPEAIVAILPGGHYYSSESGFTVALESSFQIAEQHADSVVLLGAQPKYPEVEHSWIEVGQAVHGRAGLLRVKGFQEKPPLALAQDLYSNGSLWNTSVMVGPASVFLQLARSIVPNLLHVLESETVGHGPGGEVRIADSVYARIVPTDFSRQILPGAADRLLALRLSNVDWSDLRDPYHVFASLAGKTRDLPGWAKRLPRGSTAAA